MNELPSIGRRALLRAGALGGLGLGFAGLFPAWARSGTAGIAPTLPTVSGDDIALSIGHSPFRVGGRTGHAVTVNGTLPAPLIRLREGQDVRIARDQHARRGQLDPLARADPAVPDGRRSRRQLPRHQAGHDLRLSIPGPAGGHLLVSQPFGHAGADRACTGRS